MARWLELREGPSNTSGGSRSAGSSDTGSAGSSDTGSKTGGFASLARSHLARHGLAALLEGVLQVAAHEAGPHRVGANLLLRVRDGGRILEVHDGRGGGLHNDV